jgi:hypothetical protein
LKTLNHYFSTRKVAALTGFPASQLPSRGSHYIGNSSPVRRAFHLFLAPNSSIPNHARQLDPLPAQRKFSEAFYLHRRYSAASHWHQHRVRRSGSRYIGTMGRTRKQRAAA